MPELPEVETVCRGLEATIMGARITRAVQRRKDLRVPFPKGFAAALEGRSIMGIRRRAKYILMDLDDKNTVIAHLGMSGKMLVKTGHGGRFETHDHLVLYLNNGKSLVFNDPRRFGLMLLCKTDGLNSHVLFAHLGAEPLENAFDEKHLSARLKAKKRPIKNAIMDQRVVVGVGNIYAAEALFLSGIHPEKQAGKLTQSEIMRLVNAIKAVLKAAIRSGGSTLRDYVRSSGDTGYFQHHFKVYDREDEPCEVCKASIKMIRQGGRSTFFCGTCQKRA